MGRKTTNLPDKRSRATGDEAGFLRILLFNLLHLTSSDYFVCGNCE